MVEINFLFNYFVYLSISLRSQDPFCKVDSCDITEFKVTLPVKFCL